MPLIPYEPFRHLENVRRELDHFFTNDLSPVFRGLVPGMNNLRVDVYETGNEVVVTCDIPGLERKEDVQIEIHNHQVLSIGGTVNRTNKVKDEHMHRQERFMGRFQRSVTLPANVSPEGVKATYKNGVLEIRMQKQQGDNKRKIDVQFH